MPTYLWSAKDAAGRLAGQTVKAASPEEARKILEQQGFTDLRLQGDDFRIAMDAQLRRDLPPDAEEDIEFTADEQLEFAKPAGVIGTLVRALKAWMWILGPVLLWNAYNVYRGWKWSVSTIIALVALSAILYLIAAIHSLSIAYDRLLHAVIDGRWRTVRFLVKTLRFLRWFNCFGVPDHELRFREAQVIFEQSGLEAALAHYTPCQSAPSLLPQVYWARVSQFYFAAQRYEEGLEFQNRGFQIGQKSTSEVIDRAYHLVHHGHDAEGARALLEEISGKEVMEMAQSYVSMCQGMIAYRSGAYTEARAHFEQAEAQATAFSGTPLIRGHINLIRAYLCLACARLGDNDRSRTLFRRVSSFLHKHHELRLLSEYRALVT